MRAVICHNMSYVYKKNVKYSKKNQLNFLKTIVLKFMRVIQISIQIRIKAHLFLKITNETFHSPENFIRLKDTVETIFKDKCKKFS